MGDKNKALKSCPFCGGEASITKHFREEMYNLIHRCPNMGAMSIDWRVTKDELIRIWNTRAGEKDTND